MEDILEFFSVSPIPWIAILTIIILIVIRLIRKKKDTKQPTQQPQKHTNMSIPPRLPETFQHAGISLWQSIVTKVAKQHIEDGNADVDHHLDHPMVKAAAIHAQSMLDSRRLIESSCEPEVYFEDPIGLALLSKRTHAYVDSLPEGHIPTQDEIMDNVPVRCYSTNDRYFIGLCGAIYAYYKFHYGIEKFYIDWGKRKPAFAPDFGVIKKKLPKDAKVGIIGDWATGLNDTKELLKGMLRLDLDAVIHLGDIYYAGTPDITHEGRTYPGECTVNFKNIFLAAYQEISAEFQKKGKLFTPPPVFNLAGNHDYYCMGKGFFELLPTLPSTLAYDADFLQEASYFQLMLEDDSWQFLAMDTGRNDYSVVNVLNPDVIGPILEPNEVLWHRQKMNSFGGKTILLSHHQLFSANTTINGKASDSKTYFINEYLYSYFSPFFKDHVHAWFWGHEHNLVGFADGQLGLSKGRLVGNGGYQSNEQFDHPDKINYPQIRVNTDFEVKRDSQGYLYHSACILDFGNRDTDGNPIAKYYQMPSWGRTEHMPAGAAFVHMPGIDEYLTSFKFNMPAYLPVGMKSSNNIRVNVYYLAFWHQVGTSNRVSVGQNAFSFASPFKEDSISMDIQVTANKATINIHCNYDHLFGLGNWKLSIKDLKCTYEFGFKQVDDHLPFDNPEVSYIKYKAVDGSDFEMIQYQAPAIKHIVNLGNWNASVVFEITNKGTTYWIAVEDMG